MKAARFHEYGSADVLRYEDAPEPVLGEQDVLVCVRACAVNHVDIDMRDGSSRLPLSLPHTLGFEVAGDVEAVGADVDGVAPGDRVSPLYQLHCRTCEWCVRGDQHHCESISMPGVQVPGGSASIASLAKDGKVVTVGAHAGRSSPST